MIIIYENENARLLLEGGKVNIKDVLIKKKPTARRYISEKKSIEIIL